MLVVITRPFIYMWLLIEDGDKTLSVHCLIPQNMLCSELPALTSTNCSLSGLTLNLQIGLHYKMRTKTGEGCHVLPVVIAHASAEGSYVSGVVSSVSLHVFENWDVRSLKAGVGFQLECFLVNVVSRGWWHRCFTAHASLNPCVLSDRAGTLYCVFTYID